MRPTTALRRHLLGALGLAPVVLAACQNDKGGDEDTDADDTDVVDSDTLRDTSPDETDVVDTEVDDTDVVDTEVDDTDVVDTEVDDTDVVDSDTDLPDSDTLIVDTVIDTDTAVPSCNARPSAIAEIKSTNWLSGTDYEVCTAAQFTDPGCATTTSVDLETLVTNAFNPPGSGFPSVNLVCGPYPGPGGECCFETQIFLAVPGRPFATDHGYRTGGVVAREGWARSTPLATQADRDRAAAAWEAAAAGEHASIASFATFVLDLLSLGAPADLVHDASVAMADEVRHAAGAFAVASSLRGHAVGPAPLPTADARARATHEDLLRAVIVEGCVNETLSAHEAALARDAAADEAVRAHLARVADDEARHAALAWRTLRWLLAERPELRELAEATMAEAVDAVRARPAGDDPHLPELGLIGGAARRDAARLGLDRVVRPTWDALRVA